VTKPKQTRNDDNEPATKGFVRDEIAELAEAVKVGFDNTATKDDLKTIENDVGTLKSDVGTLKNDVEGLKTGQDRIERRLDGLMDVLDENNQLLKGLPERVERLEQKPFPHQ
jgi:chromosome segregation ATPase